MDRSHDPDPRSSEERFRELYLEHYDDAVAYLRRRLRVDQPEAEMAVQDAFVTAWTSFDRIPPDPAFRAWIVRLAQWRALDLKRARARQQYVLSYEPDVADLYLDRLEHEESARRIQAALAELTSSERALLYLRATEALTYAETGQILGISSEAARRRFSRVRAKLAEALREELRPEQVDPRVPGTGTGLLRVPPIVPSTAEPALLSTKAGRITRVDDGRIAVLLIDESGQRSIASFSVDDLPSGDRDLIEPDTAVVVTEHRVGHPDGPGRMTRVRIAQSEHALRDQRRLGPSAEDREAARRILSGQ